MQRKTASLKIVDYKHCQRRYQLDENGKKIRCKVIRWDKNGNHKSTTWVKYDQV